MAELHIKELHVKLSNPAKDVYQAEIIEPTGVGDVVPAPSGPGWPCPLYSTAAALGKLQQSLLEHDQQGGDMLETVSADLFQFLFGPPNNHNLLYTYWQQCLTESLEGAADGMRLVLHSESDELRGAPWELMYDDAQQYLAMLPLDKPHTLVRSNRGQTGVGPRPAELKPSEPLRVLLAICLSSTEDTRIFGSDEALRVDTAFYRFLPWQVDLHVLVRPKYDELKEWCESWRPHIFHFVGHGIYNEGEATLLLQQDTAPGTAQSGDASANTQITPRQLAELYKGQMPRLVVLNACRTGQIGDRTVSTADAARAVKSFTDILIERGVLAVIAMQADIHGNAASLLMGTFYQELTKGQPIDLALSRARETTQAIFPNTIDWALPALYLAEHRRAEDAIRLDPQQSITNLKIFGKNEEALKHRSPFEHVPLPIGVRLQVGYDDAQRCLEARLLREHLDATRPITLLLGDAYVGKTNLLLWLSEACARRGRAFIYADCGAIERGKMMQWLDILRLIRDGRLESKIAGGIHLQNALDPTYIFNRFNYELNAKATPDYVAQRPIPDEQTPVVDEAGDDIAKAIVAAGSIQTGESPLKSIAETFWSGLKTAAKPNGLVIFFDHGDNLPPDVTNYLDKFILRRLLVPEQDTETADIHVVLALQDLLPQPWGFLMSEDYANHIEQYILPGFSIRQLDWLAKVWARRYFLQYRGTSSIRALLNKFIKEQDPKEQLLAETIDSYVKQQINFYIQSGQPIPPGNLVRRLAHFDDVKLWLNRKDKA